MDKIKVQMLQTATCSTVSDKWLLYTALATCIKTSCIKVAVDYKQLM
jgi:hypothetical protein